MRNTMCDCLRSCGIDTSILFPFPVELSRDSYPHAAEAADEVVTLPLGPDHHLGRGGDGFKMRQRRFAGTWLLDFPKMIRTSTPEGGQDNHGT